MSFKLKKDEIKTLMGHVEAVRTAHAQMEDAVAGYNSVRESAVEFVDGLAQDFRSQFDDKSETWQQGERGDAANEFIERFEAIIQEHDELLAPESTLADDLAALDHEMGG